MTHNDDSFLYYQSEQYPKSSEEIIADWKINPVEINYTEDEYRSLTTFRYYSL